MRQARVRKPGWRERLAAWWASLQGRPQEVPRAALPPARQAAPPPPPARPLTGPAPAPPPAPTPSPDVETLKQELRDLKEALQAMREEIQHLHEALPKGDHPPVHIHRVDRMDIQHLYHVIGRLAVDQLDGTLNVGFSRNLRVNPRVPAEAHKAEAAGPSRTIPVQGWTLPKPRMSGTKPRGDASDA